MHLVFSLILAIMGSVCTSYYAKNYNEKEFNPLPIYKKEFNPLPIYIGLLFMMAGSEISKFVG